MAFLIDNKYRVKRNLEFEKQMKVLTDKKIFKNYSDILTVSAMIGYKKKQRIPFTKNAETVQLSFFSGNDLDLIDLLAFAETKDKQILNSKDKYQIFEEYANGGFPYLFESLEIDDLENFERESVLLTYFNLLSFNDFSNEEAADLFED